VSKGVYNCHGCGIKGNAYQYLTDIRRLDPATAKQALRDMGGSDAYVAAAQASAQEAQRQEQREPRWTKEPYGKARISKDTLADRVDLYPYPDAAGNLVFQVGRYEAMRDDKDKPDKTFRPFTPCPEPRGGYWAVGPMSDQLPLEYRIDRYPIFRLPAVAAEVQAARNLPANAQRQIWLVEGEKGVKIIERLQAPGGKSPIVCSLYGGSKHPLDNHDLTILYGQKILLLADSDKGGRAFMRNLGKHLAENECEVRYLLPAGDDGYDVGDAAAKGWDALLAFIKKVGIQDHAQVFDIKPDETTNVIPPFSLADTPYFRVMGFEGERVVLQSKRTHKIHKVAATAIGSEGNLIYLAPLQYWRGLAGNKDISTKHRAVWMDALIRAAEERGEISTQGTHMWNRGAHKQRDGEIVYNVGNGILRLDPQGLLTRMTALTQDIQSTEIYLPGPKIELQDDPNAALYAADLHDAVMRYRWERPEHGHAFLGWLVTSLVGGALPFRPMLWLTALPDTGKTFLLEQVLNPLFDNLVSDWASVTEAGMAAQTADTSLPAYADEFEPEPGRERRMNDVLALMRSATSGGASRTRGTAQGEFYQSRVRFSLLMASIDRPTLSEANASRIRSIRLSTRGVEDWPSVRDELIAAVEPAKALALRTHIIRHTAKIVGHAKEIEDEMLAEDMPTREAHINSALSAGVAFLSAEPTFRLGRQAGSMSDEYRPFILLMSSTIRGRFTEDTTVAEALRTGYFDKDGRFLEPVWQGDEERKAAELAKQHGFAFVDDTELYCAIGWRQMEMLLRETPFAQIDLAEYILRLPGAYRPTSPAGHYFRFTFGGVRKNIIAIPRETLSKMGLFIV